MMEFTVVRHDLGTDGEVEVTLRSGTEYKRNISLLDVPQGEARAKFPLGARFRLEPTFIETVPVSQLPETLAERVIRITEASE